MFHRSSFVTLWLPFLLCCLPWQSHAQADLWSGGGVHPVVIAPDADASVCAQCHATISKGKYVHTALATGCTTCHTIKTANGATSVTLTQPVTQLCQTCHPLSGNKVSHRPYQQGDCIVCHSPHSSNFPAHTWVSQQDTCLGCHARERLQVNAKKKTVTVPWGVTLTFDQMKGWRYLNLNSSLTANHPLAGHPVSGPNSAVGPNAPPITCLSCHRPHASNFTHLLIKTAPDPSMGLCKSCSLCLDCHKEM